MPRYVMLLKYTDNGIAKVQESPKRADTFRALASKHGAKVETQLWTTGEYDGLVVLTVPDDTEMAALALGLGKLDYVRSTSLRAFDEAEFQTVLGRVG
ncbi:MAG TPA: GYD domain-containing protein [Gemmataceae bacterium]|jgi:uncharacterized protein with GYD domain|nr:GYD domain-containing protein [Gemmataceae bacterium]